MKKIQDTLASNRSRERKAHLTSMLPCSPSKLPLKGKDRMGAQENICFLIPCSVLPNYIMMAPWSPYLPELVCSLRKILHFTDFQTFSLSTCEGTVHLSTTEESHVAWQYLSGPLNTVSSIDGVTVSRIALSQLHSRLGCESTYSW